MRKYVALLGIAALASVGFASDITIFDGQTTSIGNGLFGTDLRVGIQEDGEVSNGCVTGQQWDLEAFTLTGNDLGLVSGFNVKDGLNYGGQLITGGDIFIKVGSAAPVVGPDYTSIPPTVGNSFGYNYAIDLTKFNVDGTGTYTIYSLDGSSNFLPTNESINGEANPWDYVGTTGKTGTFTYAMNQSNDATKTTTGIDLKGGNHNIISGIDLSFLHGQEIWTHYTMQCGNDNLMGHGAVPVPEPGSLMLFGTGLLGLIGFAFGRRKK